MIREYRVLFDPEDISHVRLHCKHCQEGLVLHSLANNHPLPRKCPSCQEEWWPHYADRPSQVPEVALLWALQMLCQQDRPVRVQLESQETARRSQEEAR